MPRFVVLEHRLPAGHQRGLHWDLMLESDGTLATWALEQPPAAGAQIEAEALANHRLEYLEFEGPVPGDRGRVTRWEWGSYRLLSRDEQQWVFDLEGDRLRGRAVLRRDPKQPQRWRLLLGASGALAMGLNSGSQTSEPSAEPRVVRPAT